METIFLHFDWACIIVEEFPNVEEKNGLFYGGWRWNVCRNSFVNQNVSIYGNLLESKYESKQLHWETCEIFCVKKYSIQIHLTVVLHIELNGSNNNGKFMSVADFLWLLGVFFSSISDIVRWMAYCQYNTLFPWLALCIDLIPSGTS